MPKAKNPLWLSVREGFGGVLQREDLEAGGGGAAGVAFLMRKALKLPTFP